MSKKQAAAVRGEKEKDWDVDETWERVRAASLKDPVVARYVADLNKPVTSQEEQSPQASWNRTTQGKIKAKERYPIKFRKHPPPP